MGSALLATSGDGKDYCSVSPATLDLFEPLIVFQPLIIAFPNLACLKKNPVVLILFPVSSSFVR